MEQLANELPNLAKRPSSYISLAESSSILTYSSGPTDSTPQSPLEISLYSSSPSPSSPHSPSSSSSSCPVRRPNSVLLDTPQSSSSILSENQPSLAQQLSSPIPNINSSSETIGTYKVRDYSTGNSDSVLPISSSPEIITSLSTSSHNILDSSLSNPKNNIGSVVTPNSHLYNNSALKPHQQQKQYLPYYTVPNSSYQTSASPEQTTALPSPTLPSIASSYQLYAAQIPSLNSDDMDEAYLHLKTPSSYENHPSRNNWSTTSHVIEHLQGTIDSLRRELKEQQAKAEEERSCREAMKKRCTQLESQMEGLRHQTDTLSSMLQRKERKVKELERDLEEYKSQAGDFESQLRTMIQKRKEEEKASGQALEEAARAKASYEALVSGMERKEEQFNQQLQEIGRHLAFLTGFDNEGYSITKQLKNEDSPNESVPLPPSPSEESDSEISSPSSALKSSLNAATTQATSRSSNLTSSSYKFMKTASGSPILSNNARFKPMNMNLSSKSKKNIKPFDFSKLAETLRQRQAEENARIEGLRRKLTQQEEAHKLEIERIIKEAQASQEESERKMEARVQETLALVRQLETTEQYLTESEKVQVSKHSQHQ